MASKLRHAGQVDCTGMGEVVACDDEFNGKGQPSSCLWARHVKILLRGLGRQEGMAKWVGWDWL